MPKHTHSYSYARSMTHDHEYKEGHIQQQVTVPVDPNRHTHVSKMVNSAGVTYMAERTHSHTWAGLPGDPHDHAFAPWNMMEV